MTPRATTRERLKTHPATTWDKVAQVVNGEQYFALAYVAALNVDGEKGERAL